MIESVTVIFTYSATTGLYTGTLSNGVRFTCLNDGFPTKLENALTGLRRQMQLSAQAPFAKPKEIPPEQMAEILKSLPKATVYTEKGHLKLGSLRDLGLKLGKDDEDEKGNS